MLAIGLALAAAASWGVADFLAGMFSRRLPVIWVLLLIESGGLVVIVLVALASGEPFFDESSDVLLAAGAGAAGVTALGCFYRALAIGTMSIVAPVAATGVILPVVVGFATGDTPSALTAVGLAIVIAGVIAASREHHHDEEAAAAGRASVGLALFAAVGFGAFFALSDPATDGSLVWTLVLVRAVPVPFVAAAAFLTRAPRPGRRDLTAIAAAGTIDLAATSLIALANREGDLEVVSVLGSMYPVMTVILAAAVLGERLARPQAVGVAAALGGVALVVLG